MVGEAGPEMIVPLSGGASGIGGVTIGNITVNGVSGDPSDFAYAFAEELRRELKTQ